MKLIITNIIFIITVLLIANCDAISNSNTSNSIVNQDSTQLRDLVRQYLKWAEIDILKHKLIFFSVKKNNPTDTNYSNIDWTNHQENMRAIEKSNFFTSDFLANYQKIALHLDSALKQRTIVWRDGEIPNFSASESDPWCNCQDTPNNYLEKIIITKITYNKDIAIFNWTWGDNFQYQVRAKKINGTWKIDYLEGFDIKYYKGN